MSASPATAAQAAAKAKRSGVLERRTTSIGPAILAKLTVPVVLAWLDAHQGRATAAGRVYAQRIHSVATPERIPAPAWVTTAAGRGVEALVLEAAREGWRVGVANPVKAWRRSWAGYAEAATAAWEHLGADTADIPAEAWEEAERLGVGVPGANTPHLHPALAATSALVRKMLAQTARNHIAPNPDARTLSALQIPKALWRAIGEAGPCPGGHDIDLEQGWWLVEIEQPADEVPNTIALWRDGDDEVTLTAFLCPNGKQRLVLSICTWRTRPDGTRTPPAIAALKCPVHIERPDDPATRDGIGKLMDILTAPDGAVGRAKSAIAMHRANNDATPPALAPYRQSQHAGRENGASGAATPPGTELFAIERAPEPVAHTGTTQAFASRQLEGQALTERQRVRAHWKHQPFGPKRSRRRWIVVESYQRGPAPRDDQITLTRLAAGTDQSVLPDRTVPYGTRVSPDRQEVVHRHPAQQGKRAAHPPQE